ncbi:hypothetical protein [Legionella cardiaca]|uniref:Coiled-coil protein n=1 Tax=Legionella cardiaca TaxID=1071983 RepID=A0ABY8AR60_9GAMM|nr:hypothetical protein [Legionella cardiaca]WED43173.1 hypothetical protein PXX05_14960 [Legionella cardiaca]
MSIATSLKELEARLPELEWKMGSLGRTLPIKLLPKGLFRLSAEANPAAFMDDIKADLNALAKHQSEYSGHYLAQRIHQKINVLVALCCLESPQPVQKNKYYLNMITTRQAFVRDLEKEITRLTAQRKAILERLENTDTQLSLGLKSELGEIEKRLTLAREAITRATQW